MAVTHPHIVSKLTFLSSHLIDNQSTWCTKTLLERIIKFHLQYKLSYISKFVNLLHENINLNKRNRSLKMSECIRRISEYVLSNTLNSPNNNVLSMFSVIWSNLFPCLPTRSPGIYFWLITLTRVVGTKSVLRVSRYWSELFYQRCN